MSSKFKNGTFNIFYFRSWFIDFIASRLDCALFILAVVKLGIETPTSNQMNWFKIYNIQTKSNNVGGSFTGGPYLHNRKLIIVEY